MRKILKKVLVFIVCFFMLFCAGCEQKIIEAENNNHIFNPTISEWENNSEKQEINTNFEIDFDKVNWDSIENIKFFIYFGTRLVGTAESKGENLDNLLTQIEDSGVQVINCNFYRITKKSENDGYFIRSYCNIEYPEKPNYIKITLLERKEDKIVRYTISNNKYKLEN